LPDDDLHSSSRSRFIDIPSILQTEGIEIGSIIYQSFIHYRYSNEKDRQDNQTKQRLKSSLIFIEIWLTIISLTVLLIALYLLFNINQTTTTTITMTTTTSTTTTTTSLNNLISLIRTYFMISLGQIQLNQTNSSVTTKEAYYCSGVSQYTLWTAYYSHAITMHIDTSNCSFNSTPFYYTSVDGIGDHFDLVGYTAIYDATNNSFKVYSRPFLSYKNNITAMLSDSLTREWRINWLGILN